MKRAFLRRILICLALATITACESIQAEEITNNPQKSLAGDGSGQLSDQGKTRTYYMYTPKSYNPDRPMPLVLVFHGDDGSGHSMADVTRFNTIAEQKGFIVVYPDGIDHRWSLRGKSPTKVNDVSFVSALINHIEQTRNIDSKRIYAAGFSKGAILTQVLACELPDKIAAFASVAGALPVRYKSHCQPQAPVSMLMINGTNDQEVHYQGDDSTEKGSLISIQDTVNFWRSHDQCQSPLQTQAVTEDDKSDRFKVKTARYNGCTDNSEILQLAVVDGGHFWPGGASQDPQVKQVNNQLGFSASETIWDFFQNHNLL